MKKQKLIPATWQNKMIPGSIATTKGEKVTTILDGGVGLGYVFDDIVYKSGGNGYYYSMGTTKLKGYYRDSGQRYRDEINRLALPPAYKL